MKFEITKEQVEIIGNYLVKRPYEEVVHLLNILQSLIKIEEKQKEGSEI